MSACRRGIGTGKIAAHFDVRESAPLRQDHCELPAPLPWSRRRLLGSLAGGLCAMPLANVACAETAAVTSGSLVGAARERWLELANTHTAEIISVAYRSAAGYASEGVAALAHLLRDHRNGDSCEMDPGLYDQLADLAYASGVEPRFEVISGYRSPATNARLVEAGRGVAKHSLHTQGRAIDVRLRGVSCAKLRDLALSAARGGVGYYHNSNFVHLDTGRVRAWVG
jgi:uncharacterized protein YcbK (DUF882 family)